MTEIKVSDKVRAVLTQHSDLPKEIADIVVHQVELLEQKIQELENQHE